MRKAYTTIKLLTVLSIPVILSLLAGWITHIVYCFQNQEYLLLLAGVLVAPVGSIHGIGLWFGFW